MTHIKGYFDNDMERIRRLFVVLVWLAYVVAAFMLTLDFLDHPRDENASLISFGLIILTLTILAAFLLKV